MARTTTLRPSGLAGGMRGAKTEELVVAQPRPSLSVVLAMSLARAMGRLMAGAWRHPATLTGCVLLGLVWLALGTAAVAGVLALAGAALPVWRRLDPISFRRVVVSGWRGFWVYRRRWQPAMATCGLSVHVDDREYLPRLRKVVAGQHADRVCVELLSGQSPGEFEAATAQLGHTFEALACRVHVERPGRVVVEFTHGDPLADPVPALDPDPVPDLGRLVLGRREDGNCWTHHLLGTHLLVAGATGSGKGSVVWSLIRAMGPAIRDGSVQIWAVDPKGGMELTPGAGLFTRFAYAEAAAMVDLLDDAVTVMRERAERLREAGQRTHTPSQSDPLVVVVVDELAALTAYLGDRDLKRRAETALQLLLSQGRAPGVLVVAAVQDPGKDVVGFRDLFSSRIGLRLLEDVQVDMVLGRSARQRGAECDQIPATQPGVGYVVLDGVREPVRVRACYVTDEDLARMVEEYRPETGVSTASTSGSLRVVE